METFFCLNGICICIKRERNAGSRHTNDFAELAAELKQLNLAHHIVATFSGYRSILPHVTDKSDATYFLVALDPEKQEVKIKGFKKGESKLANAEYTEAEKALDKVSRKQVVLVSVASVSALKRAYPNYFLDTDEFLKEVQKIIS